MAERSAFYYLESAPQVMSAYRHIRQYGVSGFDMLVRLNGSLHNDGQIARVMEELPVRQYGAVTCLPVGWKFFLLLVQRLLFRRYREFCIADIRSTTGLVAATFSRSGRILLLDDGVASIDYYQRRLLGLQPFAGGFFKRLISPLARFRTRHITLYTLMPLESQGGMSVQRSTFPVGGLGDVANAAIDDGVAVFIGSKVVESGVCSEDYFCRTLRGFVARFEGRQLVYVLHREEDAGKLAQFPALTPVRLDLPLELEFGVRQALPGVVASFYSAGLLGFLPYRGRMQLLAYGLPLEAGNARYHQSIEAGRYLFQDLLGLQADA